MSLTLEGYVFPIINLSGVIMTARVYDYKKPNVIAAEFNGNVDDLTKALPDVRVLTEQNAHSLSTTRSGFLVMKPGDFVVREAGTGFPSWSLLSAEDFANNFKPVATAPEYLPEHMKRVYVEVKELDAKLAALGKYLGDGGPHSSAMELDIQKDQFDHMDAYSKALHKRLAMYAEPVGEATKIGS